MKILIKDKGHCYRFVIANVPREAAIIERAILLTFSNQNKQYIIIIYRVTQKFFLNIFYIIQSI